jgi:hypothetical protein
MIAIGFNKPLYILPFDHQGRSRPRYSVGPAL